VSWHIDDVAAIRPDLSAAQRRAVLDQVSQRYDATIGITWDVLAFHAESLYGASAHDEQAEGGAE
jgi:hypothetical protein